MSTQIIFIVVCGLGLLLIAAATHFSGQGSLDSIKSKTVGDGQHGTARWATKQEIQKTYAHVPFQPELWRKGEKLPKQQGLILGCEGRKGHVIAIRRGQVHCRRNCHAASEPSLLGADI